MKDNNHLPLYGIGPILCIPTVVITAVFIFLSVKGLIPGSIQNNGIRTIQLIIGVMLIIEGILLFFCADVGGSLQDNIKENTLKTNGSYKFV